MTYSNEAVLEALRRAQLRQVPWVKRPLVFEFLRTHGLLETVRQRTAAAPGYHSPVDIAVLTELGKAEIERLAFGERAPQWPHMRALAYSRRTADARSGISAEMASVAADVAASAVAVAAS